MTQDSLLSYFSVATARNPEVVRSMSSAEKGRVVWEGLAFHALGLLTIAQWYAFLSVESRFIGALAAAVMTVLVLAMDYQTGAAIEHRIARNDSHAPLGFVFVRVVISLAMSSLLAVAFMTRHFADTIDIYNQQVANRINEPLQREFDTERAQARRDHLARPELAIKRMEAERGSLIAQVAELNQGISDLRKNSSIAKHEQSRQEHGAHGAVRGRGSLYLFAQEEAQNSASAADRLTQQVSLLQQRLTQVESQLDVERQNFDVAKREFSAHEQRLGSAMRSDPRYQKVSKDFLGRVTGLLGLMNSDKHGTAMLVISALAFLVLLALDAAYLACKLNLHGMSYGRRDILRERRDLEAYAQEMQHQIHALRVAARESGSGASQQPVILPISRANQGSRGS